MSVTAYIQETGPDVSIDDNSNITVDFGTVIAREVTTVWGGITGTLSDQADLLAAFNKKIDYSVHDKLFFDGQNQVTAKTVLRHRCTHAGYLTAASIKLLEQRTAGTITLTIEKNGVAIAGTGLNIAINASYPLDRSATVNYGTAGYDFAAGDSLTVKATSDAFTPLANILDINIHIIRDL